MCSSPGMVVELEWWSMRLASFPRMKRLAWNVGDADGPNASATNCCLRVRTSTTRLSRILALCAMFGMCAGCLAAAAMVAFARPPHLTSTYTHCDVCESQYATSPMRSLESSHAPGVPFSLTPTSRIVRSAGALMDIVL